MFKSKVHFAFYKSLKSRLIFMIFVLVLVPEVVLCFGILNTYESRAVSIRESEVLSQAKILANKISTSKYFDKDGSDLTGAGGRSARSNESSFSLWQTLKCKTKFHHVPPLVTITAHRCTPVRRGGIVKSCG